MSVIFPEEQTAWEAITSSNLTAAPTGDVAVIGWGLESIVGNQNIHWQVVGAFSWFEKNS